VVFTVSETTPVPPTMTMFAGWSRLSSPVVTAGMESLRTKSTGALVSAATEATPRASGKFSPVATYTVSWLAAALTEVTRPNPIPINAATSATTVRR